MGDTFSVTNSGTAQKAVLDFVFPDVSVPEPEKGATVTKETFDVIIKPTDWVNGACVISNPAIKEDSFVFLTVDPGEGKEGFQAMARACIIGGTQTNGSIQLKALNVVPEYEISVLFGVM